MSWSTARCCAVLLAPLALAACAGGPMYQSGAPAPAPAVAAVPVSPDQDFVNRATTGTTGQVELGRLAEQRAFSPAVRSFGRHIAAEHTQAHDRLLALSQRLGVVPNPSMPDVAQLAALSGPQFDQQFMADQMKNQQEALALFQSEAQMGREPRLRQFAREWLPRLRGDLQRAEGLATRTGS